MPFSVYNFIIVLGCAGGIKDILRPIFFPYTYNNNFLYMGLLCSGISMVSNK